MRELWSQPDTRRKLLDELEEKGYGQDQLTELTRLVDAQNSDLYDVLAYVAFSQPPVTREERVEARRDLIYGDLGDKQREFLDFVLDHYIRQGVRELDTEKLRPLLELKYHAISDAVEELGGTTAIRSVFVDFQKHLYSAEVAT